MRYASSMCLVLFVTTTLAGCAWLGNASLDRPLAEMNVLLPPVPLVFVPPSTDSSPNGGGDLRRHVFHGDSLTLPEGWWGGVNPNGEFVFSAPRGGVVGQCILSSTPLPIAVDTPANDVMAHFIDQQGLASPAQSAGLSIVFMGAADVDGNHTVTVDSETVVGQLVNGTPAGSAVRIRQVYRAPYARLRVLSCLGPALEWSTFEPLIDEIVGTWTHAPSE